MVKVCSRCHEEKDVECFCVHRGRKDGRNSFCRECNKKYHKLHYSEKKAVYIKKQGDRQRAFDAWFKEFKKTLKCEICGEDHPATLDFHHRDPKQKDHEVSRMRSHSMEKVMEEIAKCNVWCSNCHRKFHWAEPECDSPMGH